MGGKSSTESPLLCGAIAMEQYIRTRAVQHTSRVSDVGGMQAYARPHTTLGCHYVARSMYLLGAKDDMNCPLILNDG